jgi:5-methyltetrahydropteroyltriglutamate--homocysteine methyltransferase
MSAARLHIETTHTGSLPRPDDLTDMLVRRDRGEAVDGFEDRAAEAAVEVVRAQAAAGITVVNDGEVGKISYATYVKERLEGFDGDATTWGRPRDYEQFRDFYDRRPGGGPAIQRPACSGPVRHRGPAAAEADVARFRAALQDVVVDDAFLTAASPGIIARYLQNQYYASHEEYIWSLAEAMKPEYDAVHAGGFLLQLDCPDLTSAGEDLRLHIEAINEATRDIPPERMRLHLCWGNAEGPHTYDVPLADIIDVVYTARPAMISFEGANPRHEHEWRVFSDHLLPAGKKIIPGVLDSTTNFVEHPQVVADRIVRYASLVGPENVIAGSDCGFATIAIDPPVAPSVTWAKLRSLGEGARLAERELAVA